MKNYLLVVLVLLMAGCGGSVALPEPKNVTLDDTQDIKKVLKKYPKERVESQNILEEELVFAKLGELNSYEVTITPDFATAYQNYLGGDGEKAVSALENISKTSKDNKVLWQASMLKMKTLIMMGLGDDAIEEFPTCQEYEKLTFNTNLNCLAQRGEAYVWAQDFKNAKKDLHTVLLSIGNWNLPSSYMSPPSNMVELVATTTAQLRAYTSLAAMYTLQENYEEAYYWADEADKRYDNLLYVSNHWLYGKFVKLHLDTYYGTATNLTFLASAQLAKGMNKKAELNFDKAIAFFKKMKYAKGKATVLALKARVFNRTGQHDKCNTAGKIALDYALKNGFLDFVWRIEALRGETFAMLGDKQEAQAAYRRAANTINSLSSALATDSSKRKFGYSKDDITLALLRYDIQNKDYQQLFIDAEENRARAFVDTLSKRTINSTNPLLKEIYELDKKIDKQLILNTAIGADNASGVAKLKELLELKTLKELELQKSDAKLSSVVSVWSSSLQETQKNLAEDSLIYFLPSKSKDAINYLLIDKDSYSFHSLALTKKELDKDLKTLSSLLGINSIQTRGLKKVFKKSDVVHPESIDALSAKLSKILNIKTKNKSVYIVASDETNFIPWGMLEVDFTATLLPTASWINQKQITIDSNKAVILGNPKFGVVATQLPGAESEAKELAKMYAIKPLLFKKATKENLRAQVGSGVNTLHFATHGLFYKDTPLKSALLLSDGTTGVELNADEIFAKPLRANLVVLSACESGLGESASANDYLGLSRSFFLGGTKSVLSSLWAIDDEGTKEFMRVFHKYAKDGQYAKAYQMARDALKEKGYPSSIYGAFVLQGLSRLP